MRTIMLMLGLGLVFVLLILWRKTQQQQMQLAQQQRQAQQQVQEANARTHAAQNSPLSFLTSSLNNATSGFAALTADPNAQQGIRGLTGAAFSGASGLFSSRGPGGSDPQPADDFSGGAGDFESVPSLADGFDLGE